MKITIRLAVSIGLAGFYFYAIAPMLFGVSSKRPKRPANTSI
jgi:hypothetical protein